MTKYRSSLPRTTQNWRRRKNSTRWILHMTEPCTHLPRWSFCPKRRNKNVIFSPDRLPLKRLEWGGPGQIIFAFSSNNLEKELLLSGIGWKFFTRARSFCPFLDKRATYLCKHSCHTSSCSRPLWSDKVYIQQDFMLTRWIAKVWCNFMSWWWPEMSASRCQQRS